MLNSNLTVLASQCSWAKLICWLSIGKNCETVFTLTLLLSKALKIFQLLKFHLSVCVYHMYHAYCCVHVCVCVCTCAHVSRLSVCVVWSVCHCVSPLPLPAPASHPRGHRLPVGGGCLHRGIGRPLPLHQQETVFLTCRRSSLPGGTRSSQERTGWNPPGPRWVTDNSMTVTCLFV